MIKKIEPKNDLVLTRQDVREFDAWAINTALVPGVILMENAGRSCAEFIIGEMEKLQCRKVCIFCGTGNNGGDGFVVARHLKNAGLDVRVDICGKSAKIKGDAEINYKIACGMGILIKDLDLASGNIEKRIKIFANDSDLIVDAIFGTGLTGKVSGEFDKIIKSINSLNKPIVAVDIPSGLDCDTGEPLGETIKAIATVTFVAAKKGFTNPQSQTFTGEVYIASIGIEPRQ